MDWRAWIWNFSRLPPPRCMFLLAMVVNKSVNRYCGKTTVYYRPKYKITKYIVTSQILSHKIIWSFKNKPRHNWNAALTRFVHQVIVHNDLFVCVKCLQRLWSAQIYFRFSSKTRRPHIAEMSVRVNSTEQPLYCKHNRWFICFWCTTEKWAGNIRKYSSHMNLKLKWGHSWSVFTL